MELYVLLLLLLLLLLGALLCILDLGILTCKKNPKFELGVPDLFYFMVFSCDHSICLEFDF